MRLSNVQWIVVVWFAVSGATLVVSRFMLWRWLISRGAHVEWLFVGTPGYLESVYKRLCVSTGRSPRNGLLLNAFLYASAIGAVIVYFITIVAPAITRTGAG